MKDENRRLWKDPVLVSDVGGKAIVIQVAGVMLDSDGVAHLVQEFFGAAFHILFSEDLHERSKDRIISIRTL